MHLNCEKFTNALIRCGVVQDHPHPSVSRCSVPLVQQTIRRPNFVTRASLVHTQPSMHMEELKGQVATLDTLSSTSQEFGLLQHIVTHPTNGSMGVSCLEEVCLPTNLDEQALAAHLLVASSVAVHLDPSSRPPPPPPAPEPTIGALGRRTARKDEDLQYLLYSCQGSAGGGSALPKEADARRSSPQGTRKVIHHRTRHATLQALGVSDLRLCNAARGPACSPQRGSVRRARGPSSRRFQPTPRPASEAWTPFQPVVAVVDTCYREAIFLSTQPHERAAVTETETYSHVASHLGVKL